MAKYKIGDEVSNGRYIIKENLDKGGFSEIYLAEDTKRFDQKCVVKNFSAKFNSLKDKYPDKFEKLIERFEREAKILKEIENPNIPKLLAFEIKDNLIIQDYIDGENLEKELSTKPQKFFNEQDIWEILNVILQILNDIHSRKIYHRDIYAKNIVREYKTRKLFLIDFGLAKENLSNNSNNINSLGEDNYGFYDSDYDEWKKDLYDLGATCCHLLSNQNPNDYIRNDIKDWFGCWKSQLEEQDQYINISQGLLTILEKLVKRLYSSAEQAYEEVKQKQKIDKNINLWKCIKTIKVDSLVSHWSYDWRQNYNTSIAITPDDKYIISVTNDGQIKFWDTQTGELFKSVEVVNTDEDFLLKMGLSNDGKFLVTTSTITTALKVWKLSYLLNSHDYKPATFNQEIRKKGSGGILAFSFSNDSNSVATGHDNHKIYIWLLKDTQGVVQGKTLEPVPKPDNYYDDDDYDNEVSIRFKCLAFNPKQESQLAVGFWHFHGMDERSFSNNIVILDKYTGEIITRLPGHLEFTYSLCFSSDGKFLVSSGYDQKIKIWDIEKSQELFSLTGHYELAYVVCSPTEQIIASGGQDSIINIYDLENGNKLQSLHEHSDPIVSLIFSLDGKLLISRSRSKESDYGEIRIWQKE
ncbi:protein kinase [Sphaerospermopsis kisseleviana CS-549]|uniref:Protein kinase n=1 Tax=Sphaerospermopsis kisseleviana CS-549 TaxID=3021783 RepID=A0ABT4ZN54_9CYAN|nr:protein kinase [Sphaerospermopsis kisseleviana]MDB9440822.1 protein kinase [Sphaerospermopsis kisseleviana CS-549]BAZ81950.1 serine/threonine protein kinase with WD-40 repeats [Sphaerospermopsis kisseleviana NIES-73]